MRALAQSDAFGYLSAAMLWFLGSFSIVVLAADNKALIDHERTESVIKICLGGSLRTISNSLLETADIYFHKGLGRVQDRAFEDDTFQKLARVIKPEGHLHAAGSSARELLPWMKLAIWADPENVDTYQNASYILKRFLNKPDLAVKVLKDGLIEVPNDFRLHLFLSRIYIENGQLLAAEQRCKTSLDLWPSDFSPDNPDAILYRREILFYLQLFHEVHNRQQDAIEALSEIIELYPELAVKSTLPQRLEDLKAGKLNPKHALELLSHQAVISDREFEERIHQSAHGAETDMAPPPDVPKDKHRGHDHDHHDH